VCDADGVGHNVSDGDPAVAVRPLYRVSAHPGRTTDLTGVSAERAATALVDEFARTGYAEARVADAETVRGLARTDCRRRGIRFRSLGVGATVAIFDEHRRGAWLETDDGKRDEQRANEAIVAALGNRLPEGRE
jgi:hypothetical protein